jgi:protein phosphatase PTC1
VANVGDSRAVLIRDGLVRRLSKDHKPDEEEEKKEIERRGGIVLGGRVSGILAVSRSLGDYKAEKYVSRVPTQTSVVLEAEASLVIACDGLFDVVSDEEAGQIIEEGKRVHLSAKKMAQKLTDMAIDRGTTDNVSVLVALFK